MISHLARADPRFSEQRGGESRLVGKLNAPTLGHGNVQVSRKPFVDRLNFDKRHRHPLLIRELLNVEAAEQRKHTIRRRHAINGLRVGDRVH